jgi:hypothetical protein
MLPSRRAFLVAAALLAAFGPASGVARAQEVVELHLEVPAGHPGFSVSGVTLLKAGLVVGAFDTPVMAIGGFASFTFDISASDVPDEVELEFAVPSDGTTTLYAVAGTDFAFGTVYFLPNPSPGGVIGPQPGNPATDAFFELALVTPPPPPDDTTAPTCSFELPAGGIDATVQDGESGLASIEVRSAINLVVAVPAFAPGTTDPVTVEASVVDPRRTSTLYLKVLDLANNARYCKQVRRQVTTTRSRSRTRSF